MVLTCFWCLCALISCISAVTTKSGSITASALIEGAGSAVEVCISIAGPLALWSGLGKLMGRLGISGYLSGLLSPIWRKLFPSARDNPELAQALSANISANLLGLGNAATPMGIQAVRLMQKPANPAMATDEMCRLVVMNTASIQLLPTTVAAVRAAAGCDSPLDILPCVWISSICSITAGLLACNLFRRIGAHA